MNLLDPTAKTNWNYIALLTLVAAFAIAFLIGFVQSVNRELEKIYQDTPSISTPHAGEIDTTFRFVERSTSGKVQLIPGAPIQIQSHTVIAIPDCFTRPHAAFGLGYWLVACGSTLYAYQDEKFEAVHRFPEGQHVNLSEWNSEYFLVGGKNLTLDYPNSFLYRFDGKQAELVSVDLQGSVAGMSWNGSTWLIVTGLATYFDGSNYNIVWPEHPLKVRLYMYDEKTVRNITEGIEPFGFGSGIAFIETDGSGWLVGGTQTQLDLLEIGSVEYGDSILVRYDGQIFTDFSEEVKQAQGKFLSDIVWNGERFLILGSNPEDKPWLGSFDGTEFTDLSGKVPFQHLNQLSGALWAGNYWLVADASGTGTGGYGFESEPLRIAVFNGEEFSRIGKVAGNVLLGGRAAIGDGKAVFAGVNSGGQGVLVTIPLANELIQ